MTDSRTGLSQDVMDMDVDVNPTVNNTKRKRQLNASKVSTRRVIEFIYSLLKDIPTTLNTVEDEEYNTFCCKWRNNLKDTIQQG